MIYRKYGNVNNKQTAMQALIALCGKKSTNYTEYIGNYNMLYSMTQSDVATVPTSTENLMFMTLFRDGLPVALNHWAAMYDGESVQAFQDFLANKLNHDIDTAVKVGFRSGYSAPTPMDLGLGRSVGAQVNVSEAGPSDSSAGPAAASANFVQFGGGRPRRADGRDGRNNFSRGRGRGRSIPTRGRGGFPGSSFSSGASGSNFRPGQPARPFNSGRSNTPGRWQSNRSGPVPMDWSKSPASGPANNFNPRRDVCFWCENPGHQKKDCVVFKSGGPSVRDMRSRRDVRVNATAAEPAQTQNQTQTSAVSQPSRVHFL